MLDSETGSGVIAQHVTFFRGDGVRLANDPLRSQYNELSQPSQPRRIDGSGHLRSRRFGLRHKRPFKRPKLEPGFVDHPDIRSGLLLVDHAMPLVVILLSSSIAQPSYIDE